VSLRFFYTRGREGEASTRRNLEQDTWTIMGTKREKGETKIECQCPKIQEGEEILVGWTLGVSARGGKRDKKTY